MRRRISIETAAGPAIVIADLSKILLTPRELEVLKLVAKGWRNKRIATELKITEQSVKNYVSVLCKKYQTKNRTQLTVAWLKEQPKRPEI